MDLEKTPSSYATIKRVRTPLSSKNESVDLTSSTMWTDTKAKYLYRLKTSEREDSIEETSSIVSNLFKKTRRDATSTLNLTKKSSYDPRVSSMFDSDMGLSLKKQATMNERTYMLTKY